MKITTTIPFLALTFLAIIYTGCNIEPARLILLNPQIIPYHVNTPLPANTPTTIQDFHLAVTTSTRDLRSAFNFSLSGNQAYATSIHRPSPILTDKVVSIHIRSLDGYSSNIPIQDITSICEFKNQQNTTSIGNIISYLNLEYAVDGFSDNTHHQTFTIHLKEPPVNTQQRFIIEMITDKNARLSDTTETIIITP